MKQHPIYKHLLVSESGDIYSTKSNKYLKTVLHKKGYYVFNTKLNGRKSKGILLRVHRLVAETFIDNPENKPFVNHLNGIKTDNRVENLEWVTSKENATHAWKLGLCLSIPREKNRLCKLSTEDLNKIKSLYIPYDRDFGLRALAKKYKVSHSTLNRLVSGRSESNRQD